MADRLTDYAYADEKKETVDVINLLLLGWILLGLVVYILGNIIATQIRKRKAKERAEKAPESADPPFSEPTVFSNKAAEVQPIAAAAPIADNFREKAVSIAPELLTTAQQQPAFARDSSIPVCTGDDSDIVEWINKVFLWIYKNRIVSPILEPWLTALNAKTRILSTEHGILVDFQNVLQSNQPPVFSEVLESKQPKNKVYATCEAEILNLSFDILVTQVKEKEKRVYKFILNLERLAGQLNINCVPEELLFRLHFPENAQVQLNIEPSPSSTIPETEYEPLSGLVCDIASKALSSTPVDLQFSSFPECPRYQRIELSISNALAESLEKEKEEKLLVKIVRANNIGGEKGCSKPYCVVEMDEPPQKFETNPIEYKSNPVWDESHIFIVKDISAELLFEVYDKDKQPNENFLGLGIVSVEELMKNPSQRQTIPLQPRPLEKDDVTGSLTAEFLFLGWDLPSPNSCMLGQSQMIMEEGSGKIIETNSRVTARGTIITTTTIKRTKEGMFDVFDYECLYENGCGDGKHLGDIDVSAVDDDDIVDHLNIDIHTDDGIIDQDSIDDHFDNSDIDVDVIDHFDGISDHVDDIQYSDVVDPFDINVDTDHYNDDTYDLHDSFNDYPVYDTDGFDDHLEDISDNICDFDSRASSKEKDGSEPGVDLN